MGDSMASKTVISEISPASLEAVFACLFYCLCSNAMVLSNKAILTYFQFHFPLSLMLFQALCSALILEIGRMTGKMDVERFNIKTAIKILPLNLMFVAMISTAGYATDFLSVPFLTVFKNLTNVVITFGEQRLFGKSVSKGVLFSLSIMIFGSVCAAVNDIQFSPPGYFWMSCNCCATTGYVLYMKFAMDDTKLSKNGMALFNNVLSVPILAVLVMLRERNVTEYSGFGNNYFLSLVLLSGFVGYGMSIATFYTISKTSPTTYSMVGALNKIPSSILGAFFFSAVISFGGWVGIAIGLLGGIVFAIAKANESGAKKRVYIPISSEDEENGRELIQK